MNIIALNTRSQARAGAPLPTEPACAGSPAPSTGEVAGGSLSPLACPPPRPAPFPLEQARGLVTWAAALLWKEMVSFRLYFFSSNLGLFSVDLGRGPASRLACSQSTPVHAGSEKRLILCVGPGAREMGLKSQ